MGKSSPTKLQLKHIPDLVVLQTVYCLQSQWGVWMGTNVFIENPTIFDLAGKAIPARSLHFRQKRTAHLSEICEALKPLPEKLIWKKLQKLEGQGKITGYGPSGVHYRLEMEEE